MATLTNCKIYTRQNYDCLRSVKCGYGCISIDRIFYDRKIMQVVSQTTTGTLKTLNQHINYSRVKINATIYALVVTISSQTSILWSGCTFTAGIPNKWVCLANKAGCLLLLQQHRLRYDEVARNEITIITGCWGGSGYLYKQSQIGKAACNQSVGNSSCSKTFEMQCNV